MFATVRKPAFLKIYTIPLLQTSIGFMSNSIAILFALELDANIFQINLITTIRSTMSILLLVPFGILSDRYGRRPMILYPRAILLVGTVIRALATVPNHLIIASFIGGFAGGSYFPVLLSMIADLAEPNERSEAISVLFVFSSIGMIIGPLSSTFLLTLPQMTLRSIYQITAFLQTGVLIYLATQIRETSPPTTKGVQTNSLFHIKNMIRQSSFLGLLITAFLYNFYHVILRTYIPIYGRVNLNLSNAEVASFTSYRNLGVMIIRVISTAFLTRAPFSPFLISVLVLGGLTGLIAPYTTNYSSVVLIFFVSGVSFGAFRILSTALVAKNSIAENRGIANSLLDVSQSTGNFINILTSSVAENAGLSPVFILGGVSSLSAIIPVLWCKIGR